jgi:integrase
MMMGKRGNGEGKITRRKDGRWETRYTVHSAEGPKRKVLYGKTRGAVAEKLNKALSDRSSGLTFDAVNLTVGNYLHHWLEDSVKSLVDDEKMAHSTFIRYEGIVNNHLKPALGHRKLKDLSRAEVRRLYKEKGKALAPRSVDYIHVTLQKALSQAVRDDLIPRNVASGERPRSSRHQKEARALSPTQVRALLAEASGERNEAIYIAAIHTGLRKGELLGLKWTDLDLDGGTLSVRRSLKVTDHGLDFGRTKNKASRRSVPLNKSAVAALKAHRLRQNEERLRLGELWEDQDLVFTNRVGKPINPSNLYNREYKPLLKRAGLEDERFTFHSLRHTFASALCNKRVYSKVIQSLLGHSSITQTMDTYSHLMGGMGGDAVDGLDEAFG